MACWDTLRGQKCWQAPFLHSPILYIAKAGSFLFYSFFFLIRGYHCILPMPHFRAPVSLGGELLHTSGALVFTSNILVSVSAAQEMPLDCLVVVRRV